MLRALHKSKIPLWHTEGFNPHPFVTFPLPLSLGFEGVKECMDIRLLDEEFDLSKIPNLLNMCLPTGIRVYNVTLPQMKPADIKFASFIIKLSSDNINSDNLLKITDELFKNEEILIEKKSKKGMKEINLKDSFVKYSFLRQIGGIELNLTLPAGSSNNVNPNLLLNAYKKYYDIDVNAQITRKDIYNEKFISFS